ncbi:MAG: hypothetical protein CFE46_16025 [Burkholderiales bacterium PBB6]|nr:MAG: hypothetical protein CFE46_16025 [Burkholderiales bacterium PBB6]
MALILKTVSASQGLQWVKLGLQEFMRHPLPYFGLFGTFLLVNLGMGLIPLLGEWLMMMTPPLLLLAFMLAAMASQRGHRPDLAAYLAPWRSPDLNRRRSLLTLCLMYGVACMVALQIGRWVDGGALAALMDGMAKQVTPEEMETLMQAQGLVAGIAWRIGLIALVSLPFCFAPALVFWVGQAPPQALFSSALAIKRNATPFALFIGLWLGLTVVVSQVTAMLGQAVGGSFGMMLLLGVSTCVNCAGYVSLYFAFRDCFGQPEGTEPPEAPKTEV